MPFFDFATAYVQFAGVTIGADRDPGGVRNFNRGSVSCVESPEGSLANANSHLWLPNISLAYELVSE